MPKQQYDETNRGKLFKNERKEKDTHADYRGSINVDGVEYWLDAWIKTSGPNSQSPGTKFMSLSVKPKDAPAKPTKVVKNARDASPEVVDDDVPF